MAERIRFVRAELLEQPAKWMGVVGHTDPTIRAVSSAADAVFVVHPLRRKESLFVHPKAGIAVADPVEVLFDLYDLRLQVQADAMVRHLRGKEMR